jgi:prepilin-type N-terminal cleavage/methylation domain-containing protein
MRDRKELGFSLVELLLVVVIIGIVAAMAIPAYQKGMWAAENGSAFSTLRTISSTQVTFYTQKNRFARLDEINAQLNNSVGTVVGDSLVRGKYVFEMTPPRPDDADLTTEYFITATRDVTGEALYQFELNQSGRIVQVYPVGAPEF